MDDNKFENYFSKTAFLVINSFGKYVEVSPTLLKMLGYNPTEKLKSSLKNLVIKKDQEKIDQLLTDLKKSSRANSTLALLQKDKSVVNTNLNGFGLSGDNFMVIFSKEEQNSSTNKDNQIAKDLLFKNTLLEAQSETSIDGIVVVNENNEVISVNKSLMEMWNIPEEIWLQGAHEEILPHALVQLKEPDEFLEKVAYLNNNKTKRSRDEIVLKNGRCFDRYSAPLYDYHDNYHGRVWYFHEITEIKKTQYALDKSYREMEASIAERTSELTTANRLLQKEIEERKRVESDLIETEQKWESLTQNTEEMITISDPKGIIQFISDIPEATKKAGLTADNLIGKNMLDFLVESYHAQIKKVLKKVIKDKVTLTIQVQGATSSNYYDCMITPWIKQDKVEGSIWVFKNITNLLKLEEEAKEREQRYKNLINHSHEGIWRMEFNTALPIRTSITKLAHHILYDGIIVECNKAMANMYGHNNAQDMHGKRLIDLFAISTKVQEQDAIERAKRFIKNDFRIDNSISTEKDKNGNSVYISNSTSGDIESGKLLRLWGIQRNVTKQVLAEKALKESKSNLAEAQRLAKIGDWNWDILTNKIAWSDQTFRLFGYKPKTVEVDLDLFMSHIHKDDIDNITFAINETIKNQVAYDIEFKIIDKHGALKIAHDKGEVIFDDKGKVIGMRGAIQDVTSRKVASEKLVQSEQRFRDVTTVSSDLVWEIDKEGRYVYCSDRVQDVLGYSIEEMMNMTPFDLMTEADAIKERHHFADHTNNPRAVKNHENWNITKTGEKVCLLSSMVSIFDNAGNFKGLRGMDRDVTEAKLAEKKLQKAHHELEQRVEERTKDLNDKNQELKELAYTLSHDLKAPLRGIKTLIDWVYNDNKLKLDVTSLQNFQLIDQKVVMLYGLIEGIIEYSEIGSNSGRHEKVDINSVINEVSELLNIPESVNLSIEDKLPTIAISKVYIIQVFQNLISNAIKYNDKELVSIAIGCKRSTSGWQFSVRDNGIGIDKKHHERIFGIFKTLEPKKKGDSTGIGLSIVKKIINKHNGKIWVESEVGKGSCFYFTLKSI